MILVVTPTYDARAANWPILAERILPQEVEWHMIRSSSDHIPTPSYAKEFSLIGPEPLHDACYMKMNHWLDHYGEPKGNLIHFVMDDELVPKDFYSKVRYGEITYCTMLRGHKSPPRVWHRHGTSTHKASPIYAIPGLCGLLQVVIPDEAALKLRFRPITYSAGQDGEYVSTLVNCFRDHVCFRPELEVYFNALEPGRWNPIP